MNILGWSAQSNSQAALCGIHTAVSLLLLSIIRFRLIFCPAFPRDRENSVQQDPILMFQFLHSRALICFKSFPSYCSSLFLLMLSSITYIVILPVFAQPAPATRQFFVYSTLTPVEAHLCLFSLIPTSIPFPGIFADSLSSASCRVTAQNPARPASLLPLLILRFQ